MPRAGFCIEIEILWNGGSCTVEVMDTDDESDLELPGGTPAAVRSALASILAVLKKEMIASVATP